MLSQPRASSGDEPEVMMEINTTPLIDVLLVLLQPHAVDLDLPGATPPASSHEPAIVNVVVDFDGTFLWNDRPLAGRADRDARFRALAAATDQDEVHIRPDRLAEYRWVAAVLASVQRSDVKQLAVVGTVRP